jgi:hypothetical protein
LTTLVDVQIQSSAPYNFITSPSGLPTSGNTIIDNGITDPNLLNSPNSGVYFNSFDSDDVDRLDYFSEFTGNTIFFTMTQSGTTVIYSGDSNSLKYWENGSDNGFVFGTVSGATPSGNIGLIQSASTNFVSGELIYIGIEVENDLVIPTPTPTATPSETSVTPTPTPTVTPS